MSKAKLNYMQVVKVCESLSPELREVLIGVSLGDEFEVEDAYGFYTSLYEVSYSLEGMNKFKSIFSSAVELGAISFGDDDDFLLNGVFRIYFLNEAFNSGLWALKNNLIQETYPRYDSSYRSSYYYVESIIRDIVYDSISSPNMSFSFRRYKLSTSRMGDEMKLVTFGSILQFFLLTDRFNDLNRESRVTFLQVFFSVCCTNFDFVIVWQSMIDDIYDWLANSAVAKEDAALLKDVSANMAFVRFAKGDLAGVNKLLGNSVPLLNELWCVTQDLVFGHSCISDVVTDYQEVLSAWHGVKVGDSFVVSNYLSSFFYLAVLASDGCDYSVERLKMTFPEPKNNLLTKQVMAVVRELMDRHFGYKVDNNKLFSADFYNSSKGIAHYLLIVGGCLIHAHKFHGLPDCIWDKMILAALGYHNKCGNYLFCSELEGILRHYHTADKLPDLKRHLQYPPDYMAKSKLIECVSILPEWLCHLEDLEQVYNPQPALVGVTDAERTERFRWIFTSTHPTYWRVKCKLQVRNKKGNWSKGREITAKALFSKKHHAVATPQDIRTIESSCTEDGWGDYRLSSDLAALSLIGADNVFLITSFMGDEEPIVFEEGKQELIIEEQADGIRMKLTHHCQHSCIKIVKLNSTQYEVINFNHEAVELSKNIPVDGLFFPKEAKARVAALMPKLANSVCLHTNLDGADDSTESVDVASEITVRLYPVDDHVHVDFFVGPFGPRKQTFLPGKGASSFIVKGEDGKLVRFKRSLEKELSEDAELRSCCQMLSEECDGEHSCTIEGIESILELLSELHQVKDRFNVEWPEGERFRFGGNVDFQDLQMRIKSNSSWFDVEGELALPDDQKVAAAELLTPVEQHGRFIRLSDGRFLAMSKQLNKQLDAAKPFLNMGKTGLSLHAANAWGFSQFVESISASVDAQWQKRVEAFRKAKDKKYSVPKLLDAELRDYQVTGYKWLAKLSDLGLGVCLADDMGLGKTVQALAVILKRRAKGATLVVAPASVCENWRREVIKFTPTLKPYIIGEEDREKCIKKAKNGDVLITTYGLMVTMQEALLARQWGTIVLDEAQMIKNHSAKRTKVAHSLQADFRLVTTGTPVENNLFELWSLFEFLNPGMLGTKNHFLNNFAKPIQSDQDEAKKHDLKCLVKPFILRRKKSDVLEDLPPKTEISLEIQLSDRELAIYENIREESLAIMADPEVKNPQFLMLAQLTKLRRACCHPSLVTKRGGTHTSSKLKQLVELVLELKDGGHRVLVFSQFVTFLQLAQRELDAADITYQYLDGSTTVKKRQDLVDKFQGGEGDAFLISLKAGGTGLNLTAADYVVHLDPWWNPASEDQASDRAHRIGQSRPVTVYRFVSKNTIEEKITRLHHEKRALSESILAGSDLSAQMSVQDIVKLLS